MCDSRASPLRRTVLEVRAVYFVLGFLWIVIGLLSYRVPVMSTEAWVILCGFPAGAAFAVVHHLTVSALRWYVVGVAVAGATRSAAYIINGSTGAIPAIWCLVTVQALFVYYLVTARLRP